jgi:signal transduction histidine kinase
MALMNAEQQERLQRSEQLGLLVLGLTHDFNNTATCVLDELVRLERQLRQLREALPPAPSPQRLSGVAALQACDRSVESIAAALQAAVCQVREVQGLYRHEPRPRTTEGADLAEAARRALDLLGGRVRVVAQLRSSEPIRVAVDRQTLLRVLMNLLLNATDAFSAEAPAPRVRIHMRLDGKGAICDVGDNGPGVAPEIRDRIFEPFITTKVATGGTGLGLAVSRDLIRAAGGELDLLETGPLGTIFRLWLPALDGVSAAGGRGPASHRQAELVAIVLTSGRVRSVGPPP